MDSKIKHVKLEKIMIFIFIIIIFLFTSVHFALAQTKVDFSRRGNIHDEILDAWNNHFRNYFASTIEKRLFQEGDVYVLYDVQIMGLQSFVEMTRRCKDKKQIGELVSLLNPVFTQLKPISTTDESLGWICSGGSICSDYRLLGIEVRLCSSQFLGLIGALATTIAENIPINQQSAEEKSFLADAFNTMVVHLNRWLQEKYFSGVERRINININDINNLSSRFFFFDVDLWYLTALSDIAELYRSGLHPKSGKGMKAFEELQGKKEGIKKLYDLFLARTFLTQTPEGMRAEIDKGFWKNFFDNRYARYGGELSPVTWKESSEGKWKMITQVEWDSSFLAPDVGWDISHARRLVPALETFVRNWKNIKAVWSYENQAFDPIALRTAYANQIVDKIWNGDIRYPLFTNFWSGDNGWYRVAYAAEETGRRFSGYPPYGLTNSIADGGYPIWSSFHPRLNTIFKNIFKLSQGEDDASKSFIKRYYPGFYQKKPLNSEKMSLSYFSFLCDLVELPVAERNKFKIKNR